METKTAPQMEIPRTSSAVPPRKCRDGEIPCVVCGKPIKGETHTLWIWEHKGGGTMVTTEEGERLNASGEGGGDMGSQPIGRDCLKRHPAIKPYLGAI